MKKIIFVLAAVVAITLTSAAQERGQKKEQFQWNKKTMDELGITADVQQKIQDIKKANDEDVKKVKTDAGLTEEQKKEKLKELRKKRMEAIEALLTAEQKKKADALRKEIEAKNKDVKE